MTYNEPSRRAQYLPTSMSKTIMCEIHDYILTVPSLSQNIGTFSTFSPVKSSNKYLNQTAVLVAWHLADRIYPASVVERVVHGCFLLAHATSPLSKKKILTEVDYLLTSPAKSASAKPTSPVLSPPSQNP